MDKRKIKRIIAREGLILIYIVLFGLILFYGSKLILIKQNNCVLKTIEMGREKWLVDIANPKCNAIFMGSKVGILLIYLGYPVYLLIHFIIWAVKTLKKK